MDEPVPAAGGISDLPNEILLCIFNLFHTRELLPLTTTCRNFHSLALRIVHDRLQIAAGLDGHTLYLECHHPSERLTAAQLFCEAIGTNGLSEALADINDGSKCVGQVARLGRLYSRFRPRAREPAKEAAASGNRVGDIPGSRTWRDLTSAQDGGEPGRENDDAVESIVTVDAQEIFSQLTTFVYLGKRENRRGLLISIQKVDEGTIRVWREWLAKQCETRRWSGGETVKVQRDDGRTSGKDRSDSVTGAGNPKHDPSILWVNTQDQNVGIKFRVKERKQLRSNLPILFESDVEVTVSYLVEFQEVLVRTMHLLLNMEDARAQVDNSTGKAIVFGSF